MTSFFDQGSNKGDERVNISNYLVFKEQGKRCCAIYFLLKVNYAVQLKRLTMLCYLSIKKLTIIGFLLFLGWMAWLIPQVIVALEMTREAIEQNLGKPSSESIQQSGSHSGLASWYDYDLEGYPRYSKDHRTCASRDFSRGSILRVIYKDRFTTCRVNDFGPEEWTGRDIDLSSLAFTDLAPLSKGILEVRIIK